MGQWRYPWFFFIGEYMLHCYLRAGSSFHWNTILLEHHFWAFENHHAKSHEFLKTCCWAWLNKAHHDWWVPHTCQNPGNVVAKMGHLNAAAELRRKGLEAKERTLGPDHPETLLVDFFFLGGGERATFFKTFFVCDMILAVNIMRCNNKLSWFQNYAKLYARVSVAYHLFAPTFWTLTSEKKKKTNMRHISKVNTSHFIDVFVDLSSILLERSPVPHPPLHCNTNVLP